MNWQEVYEVWDDFGHFGPDERWVILCRKTAKRMQIHGYQTKAQAIEGAKELFNRFVEETENILLGDQ